VSAADPERTATDVADLKSTWAAVVVPLALLDVTMLADRRRLSMYAVSVVVLA